MDLELKKTKNMIEGGLFFYIDEIPSLLRLTDAELFKGNEKNSYAA